MALSAGTLKTNEKAKILAKLQSLFTPTGLLAGEVTLFNSTQDKIADGMSEGALETVPHITSNAVVTTLVTNAVPVIPAPVTGAGTVA